MACSSIVEAVCLAPGAEKARISRSLMISASRIIETKLECRPQVAPLRRPLTLARANCPSDNDPMLEGARKWARTLMRDVHALYLAGRHPRVPWYAKTLAIVVAGYALSPIDLIPDFIPIVGYLDDLVLLPIGIALVVRLIPTQVMEECRAAAAQAQERPISRTAAVWVVAIWLLAILVCGSLAMRWATR